MNKTHIILLSCMLSAPLAFGMDEHTQKRTNPSRAARKKREREEPTLDLPALDPQSWQNPDHFEKITAWARAEMAIKPNYGKKTSNAWIKTLKATQQEVDPTVEAKIRNLAQRRQIMIQSYSTDKESWNNIAQEELCQLALENLLAVNTNTKRIKE